VPADEFYKIDTRLTIPRLAAEGWTVKVTGMVNTELELTYDQLAAMHLFEQWVTIACVSNEVGGTSSATPSGRVLLEFRAPDGRLQAGRDAGSRARLRWLHGGLSDRSPVRRRQNAMVALLMNGDLLPRRTAFPVRLIVPGLFGYVSATKWLSEIELTTWEAFNGYWVSAGLVEVGPILTQSRIDVPRMGSYVAPARRQWPAWRGRRRAASPRWR
jgi:DMSO/TMAO reductase YedYZ molybdopterin-dependent catalytic subunit